MAQGIKTFLCGNAQMFASAPAVGQHVPSIHGVGQAQRQHITQLRLQLGVCDRHCHLDGIEQGRQSVSAAEGPSCTTPLCSPMTKQTNQKG